MTLHAVCQSGSARLPWLVWLHGFLGSASEWRAVSAGLPHRQLYIDLPGHGDSALIAASGFAASQRLLQATLRRYGIADYWLVGYSLGGRLAMYHACRRSPGLRGLIVEGGHPGLATRDERRARRAADGGWAARLRAEPLPTVLEAWYRQPVFASLNDAQRANLIAGRLHNRPDALAAMLEATSLGRQPALQTALAALKLPFHYLIGARDARFQALAPLACARYHTIPAAGHNAHRENPQAFRACLESLLHHPPEESL